jgi:hypothetical protein
MAAAACFGETSTVVVRGPGGASETKEVKFLKAGDEVVVDGGGFARVRCMVRMATEDRIGVVSIPGGPTLTAHHPVRVNGLWVNPETLGPMAPASGGVVFNIVLEHTHIIIADGMPCVTLGHGLTGPGVEHGFYGTQRVLDALAVLPGWAEGSVAVRETLRDADGHACGFVADDRGANCRCVLCARCEQWCAVAC